MDYSAYDDQTLLALINAAQPEALNTLYQRYSRMVYSLAMHMVSNHETAEEITLDVFIRVWHRSQTYQPKQGRVSTWLISMTRNRAIDYLRAQQTRLDQSALRWEDILHALPPSTNGNPEQTLEQSLNHAQIHRVLSQLPPEQQIPLILAFFKGRTHREIAETLNEPLGTIKTRIRLALQKLRRMLVDDKQSEE